MKLKLKSLFNDAVVTVACQIHRNRGLADSKRLLAIILSNDFFSKMKLAGMRKSCRRCNTSSGKYVIDYIVH